MHRFTPLSTSLDTLSALLHPDEHILLSQPNTGLYNGKDKSPPHQLGSLVLTSHRLVYVSSPRPHRDSVSLDLARVRQTEYWGGFMRSSAKITLTVDEQDEGDFSAAGSSAMGGGADSAGGGNGGEGTTTGTGSSGGGISDQERAHQLLASSAASRSWVCRVCGMRNTPSARCSLCGVPNDEAPGTASSAPTSRFGTPPPPAPSSSSAALPPPVPPLPASTSAPSPSLDPTDTGSRLSCPACTFLNHHSMTSCEVCGSALFPSSSSSSHPAPSSASFLPSSVLPSRTDSPAPPSSPSSSSTPRPSTPSPSSLLPNYVRLSFRAGGASAFYAALKGALASRAWEVKTSTVRKKDGTENGGEAEQGDGAGIDAILRSLSLTTQTREDTMDTALKDLESLMAKAKEMIALAQSINAQATSLSAPPPPPTSSSNPSPSSSTPTADQSTAAAQSLASSSLLSLGASSLVVVPSAVTAADAKTEREYHLSLARELLGVLEGGKVVERMGGIVGLDEVWCFWNRARGVALVPPTDLRRAVSHLHTLSSPSSSLSPSFSRSSHMPPPPLALRTFPTTRLSVLHTPHYSLPSFTARLLDLLDLKSAVVASLAEPEVVAEGIEDDGQQQQREGVGLLELAREEGGVSVGLVRELVSLVEMGDSDAPAGTRAAKGGRVCRDEQAEGGGAGGVRWYRNWISEVGWDGQVF